MNLDIIQQTYKLAKAAREKHEDEISEAYKYTRPNRDIWRSRTEQTDRTKIFDSTAPDSVQNLVSTILNLLIPQNQQWATLSVREDVKEEVASDLKRLLDKANRTVFKTIRDSNFYIAASESLTDAIISGCGAIGMYENETESNLRRTLRKIKNNSGPIMIIIKIKTKKIVSQRITHNPTHIKIRFMNSIRK